MMMGVWSLSINPKSSEECIFQTLLSTFDRTLLFSCTVVSDSLQPHGLQHDRLPCPSPSRKACSLMSVELMTPFKHLILCRPLLLQPSIFSSIRVFSNELAPRIKWPKYWNRLLLEQVAKVLENNAMGE